MVLISIILLVTVMLSFKFKVLHKKWRFLHASGSFIIMIGMLSGCVAPVESSKQDQQQQQEATSTNLPKGEVSPQPKAENEVNRGKEIQATVISVTDGDTIKVRFESGSTEKVRMILIDTPETKHPRLGVQPFGPEAAKFTTMELNGKDITLELDVGERDQYGRLLAYVWLGDKMFNERLIEKGLARVAVFPPNTKYVDQFRAIQKKAQSKAIGIWSIENYVQDDGYDANETNQNPPSKQENTGGSYVNNPSDDLETNLSCKGKIKGNVNSKIYHVPGGRYYDSVQDNVYWFCTETEAQNAGYQKSKQ